MKLGEGERTISRWKELNEPTSHCTIAGPVGAVDSGRDLAGMSPSSSSMMFLIDNLCSFKEFSLYQ